MFLYIKYIIIGEEQHQLNLNLEEASMHPASMHPAALGEETV